MVHKTFLRDALGVHGCGKANKRDCVVELDYNALPTKAPTDLMGSSGTGWPFRISPS